MKYHAGRRSGRYEIRQVDPQIEDQAGGDQASRDQASRDQAERISRRDRCKTIVEA